MPNLPDIPVGFTTKLGLIVAGVSGVAALVSAIIAGDHTEETIGALVAAVIALYKVLDGRYNQATAAVVTAPPVDVVVQDIPSDAALAAEFEGDAPDLPGTLKE